MQNFWPILQSHIRAQVDDATWENFLQYLQPLHIEAHRVIFELPDDFYVTWVGNKYRGLLVEVFRKVTGQQVEIHLLSRAAGDAMSLAPGMAPMAPQPVMAPQAAPVMSAPQPAPTWSAPQGTLPFMAAPQPQAPAAPAGMFHQASVGWPPPGLGSAAPAAPTLTAAESWGRSAAPVAGPPAPSLHERILRAGLNPRYTFEHFVAGPSNQFCYAACSAVGERPSRVYNPLFLYGGVGLGKTHLLHAVGIELLRRNPELRVTYVTSEEFMNSLIHSLRNKDTNAFRSRFRDECDVLLMDDIQFIAGKHSTQEEFFHTFNALHQAGKQLVITSDKMPQELPELEERLRSRFTWGLIADVQPPEIETRIAIIKKKAEAESIRLGDDVAMFLATHIRSNVRELEGSLIKLKASASIYHQEVTIEFAREQLRGVIQDRSASVTVDRIQRMVASFFNVKVKEMVGQRRHRVIAHPRHVAMYLCRKHTATSFPEIGKLFGGRDHSTVMTAVRKIEEGLQEDEQLQHEVQAIEASILC